MATKASSKRELIDTGTDKRFVRRDAQGRFKESDDVGRSLRQDVKRSAKRLSAPVRGTKAIKSERSKQLRSLPLAAWRTII